MRKTFPFLHFFIIGLVTVVMLSAWLSIESMPAQSVVVEVPIDITKRKMPTEPPSVKIQPEYTAQELLPEAEKPKGTEEHTVPVTSGDNLTSVFKQVGLTARDVYLVSEATKSNKAFRRLIPEQTFNVTITNGELVKLTHNINRLKQHTLERDSNGEFVFQEIIKEPEIKKVFAKGRISDSLFIDGKKAGLSDAKIIEISQIFGWDIDFALDIRAGDAFAVLYEEKYLNGEKIGDGNILIAQFINQGREVNAVQNTDGNYYNEQGQSMRKEFLRTPVDVFRISSKYNRKRVHPVLKIVRPHLGVDYAAPTGTPIKAAGAGTITWKGTKGSYGKTIIIQHAGVYTTLYAHMSKYNNTLKRGSRVRQGQVIGYVGSTGLSTGPHLHYEFRVNGVHKNPLTVTFPPVKPLNKEQMKSFTPIVKAMRKELNEYYGGLRQT